MARASGVDLEITLDAVPLLPEAAALSAAGVTCRGERDNRSATVAEVADHPFMLGSQFHPEFKSRPDRPQPLFRDFIGACKFRRAGLDAGLISVDRPEPAGVATGSG
jgi:CTP synthase